MWRNVSWANTDVPYWRLSGFYFCYFAFLGGMVPFWNLYLEQELQFNATQIGLLSSLVLATKIIGPYLWGWLADHFGNRMRIIRIGAFLACISFAGVFWRQDFVGLFIVITIYSFFWNAVLSQFEVVTLAHLKTQTHRYTQIRLWGSIGFIVAVFAFGYLFDVLSIHYLPHFLILLIGGIWLFSLLVHEDESVLKTNIAEEAYHSNQESHFQELPLKQSSFDKFWRQLNAPGVRVFFLACFLMQFSHGPYYTFYTIYLKDLGYSSSTIGALWALGVLSEVILFAFIPTLFQRFSLKSLLMLTFALTSLRWFVIAFFADYFSVLVVAQLFHAASFGCFHAVSIEIVRKRFSDGSSGQGQAFYSAVSYGAGGAVGAIVCGLLWPMGASLIFAVAAVAVFLSLVILVLWVPEKVTI